MKNRLITSCIITWLLLFSVNSYGRSGWYAGMDLGVGFTSDSNTSNSVNDSPTNCDQILADDSNNNQIMLPDARCAERHSTWNNHAKFDAGILVGTNIGYSWHNIRAEGEYNYRQNAGKGYTDISFPGAKAPEFSSTIESFEDLQGHHFFANVYYDFNIAPKWTPYVGTGIGFALVEMDYSAQFIRKSKAEFIADNPNVNANAAGTASLINNQSLEDTLFGYQFITGIDYKLTENVFIGGKFRYAIFENFSDKGRFDSLRSHQPIKHDGSPLEYAIDADDIDFWSVSLNLKYFF